MAPEGAGEKENMKARAERDADGVLRLHPVTRPTIEDVLARTEVCGEGLLVATADGPIVSADGTLVVHRADPELAAGLRLLADEGEGEPLELDGEEWELRRAARLVAGDPAEGES